MMKNLTFILIFFVGVYFSAHAQDKPQEKKHYNAVRIENAPSIDGNLDDEAWLHNNWEGGFIQHEPYENRPPSQPTEFKICFDDIHLYVAIKAYDSAPDSITNRMSRRDNGEGDMIFIIFDSYHDLRTGFVYGVSSAGVRFDMIMSNDGQNEDTSWDPIWQAKAKVHEWGWAAEMKIPFTQLRFQKSSDEVWGIIVARQIFRHEEMSLWPAIPRDAPGIVHLAGELGGLQEVEPRKQFDITPYGVASYNTYEPEEGNPFKTGSDPKFKAGLDAKIGVTNNLTMDLTLLPDFGQVEADPSEVNLTAFETFFEEKRPFFIEGSNITSFNVGLGDGDVGNDNLFYSRRIGRRPHGYPSFENNEYADVPAFTNILGAAKLTGKTKNGISVGFIESVTAEVKANIDSLGQRSTQVIEPLSNYSLARVQKDFNKGNTIIGGAVTNTIRRLDGTDMDYLHKNATTAGIDFEQYFKEKHYMLSISGYLSHVEGSEEAITRTQMSSARYYQRPDADHVELDEDRTSLSGFGGKIQAGKIGGKWNFLFMSNLKSPGLEINDMGYQREADQMLNVLWTGYNFTEPFSIFRSLNLNNDAFIVNDFGGNLQGIGYEWNVNADFKNFWSGGTGGGFGWLNRSNTMLRGGPTMYMPDTWRYRIFVSTDDRKKVSLFAGTFLNGMAEDVSFNISYDMGITLRPLNTLTISINPNYSVRKDEFQYVSRQSMNDDDRYIFGKIDQKVLSMSLRINYNITPDLTIQYWGQPFIATGEYSNFKMITDPKAEEFSDRYHEYTPEQITLEDEYYGIDEDTDGTYDYGIGIPDFNVDEWLSNLVIRWEFLPGSTAYLVWSQSRDFYSPVGEFAFCDNMQKLFTDKKANNVFLVKLSYRFGLR
ncbi:MAG: carbohydrate binding family 9 domain-containing protein [Bacteroidales bacterium]|nr:carbohydrate binding family 9 domain-containing protein [Bacteroidales bacterium]